MENEKKIVELGWMNGWHYLPDKGAANQQILRECSKLGHKVREGKGFGRCVSSYTCAECGYHYQVDSSD